MELKVCDVTSGDGPYKYIEVKRGKLTFKMRTRNLTGPKVSSTEITDSPDCENMDTQHIQTDMTLNVSGDEKNLFTEYEMKGTNKMDDQNSNDNLNKVEKFSDPIVKVKDSLNVNQIEFQNNSSCEDIKISIKMEAEPELDKHSEEKERIYPPKYEDDEQSSKKGKLFFKKSRRNDERESENHDIYNKLPIPISDTWDKDRMSSKENEQLLPKKEPNVIHLENSNFPIEEKSSTEVESLTGSQFKRKKDPLSWCSICDETFKDTESLLEHLKSHTTKNKPQIECHICKKKFRDHRHIRDHINIHTGEKPYSCPDCNETFSVKGHLYKHRKKCKFLKLKQKDEQLNGTDIQYEVKPSKPKDPTTHKDAVYYEINRIRCGLCNKMLLPESMKKHLAYHSDNKPFYCSTCGMRFPVINDLKRHMLRHDGIGLVQRDKTCTYQCGLCPKSFWDQSHLSRHMAVHTGIKDFKCEVCGKKYPYKSGLNRHMLTHNGGLKIICGICGKKFYDSSGLKIHLRAHTGEKPFRCEDCSEEFTSKTLLRMHRGSVHKSAEDCLPDRFFCKESSCKKGFQFKSVLRTHLACAHLNRSKNIRHKIDVEFYLQTGKYWDGKDAPVHT